MGLGSVGDQGARMAFRQVDRNRNGRLEISEALSAFEQIKNLAGGFGGGSGGGGGGGW